jgi:hypothetical protein
VLGRSLVMTVVLAVASVASSRGARADECPARCAEARRGCLEAARTALGPCEARCGAGAAAERCQRGCRDRLGKGRRRCRDGAAECRDRCAAASEGTCQARCAEELRDCRSKARSQTCKRRCAMTARRAGMVCQERPDPAGCRTEVGGRHARCRRECAGGDAGAACGGAFQACLAGC